MNLIVQVFATVCNDTFCGPSFTSTNYLFYIYFIDQIQGMLGNLFLTFQIQAMQEVGSEIVD